MTDELAGHTNAFQQGYDRGYKEGQHVRPVNPDYPALQVIKLAASLNHLEIVVLRDVLLKRQYELERILQEKLSKID